MNITKLGRPAPLAHRLAHAYAAAGWRGGSAIWALANAVPAPSSAVVMVGTARLPLETWRSLDSAIYRGAYEAFELQIVAGLLRAGDACVDVGANIGLYSTLCATYGGPVVALEPSQTFDQLQDNLRGYSNAKALQFGISDKREVLHLGLTRTTGDDHASFRERGSEGPAVEVLPLSEVPEVRELDCIDFLKVDVEGWEPQVMLGAATLWREQKIGIALIEVSPQWGPVDYLQLPIEHGYECYTVDVAMRRGRRAVTLSTLRVQALSKQVNVLVMRPDRRDRISAHLLN